MVEPSRGQILGVVENKRNEGEGKIQSGNKRGGQQFRRYVVLSGNNKMVLRRGKAEKGWSSDRVETRNTKGSFLFKQKRGENKWAGGGDAIIEENERRGSLWKNGEITGRRMGGVPRGYRPDQNPE